MYIQATSKKELRDFGLITGTIFILLFGILLPTLRNNSYPLWPWILAISLYTGALTFPMILDPIYKAWMKIGHVLGWINTRVLLGSIFFLVVTPIGLIMRLFGADPMTRKLDKNIKSYRIKSKISSTKKMEVPF